MIHTIKSPRFGALSFWMPASGGYVRLETANKAGTLGHQIWEGGKFTGDTLRANELTFAKVVRKWHKQRMKLCKECGCSYYP